MLKAGDAVPLAHLLNDSFTLNTLRVPLHLTLSTMHRSKCYSHFIGEKIEAPKK